MPPGSSLVEVRMKVTAGAGVEMYLAMAFNKPISRFASRPAGLRRWACSGIEEIDHDSIHLLLRLIDVSCAFNCFYVPRCGVQEGGQTHIFARCTGARMCSCSGWPRLCAMRPGAQRCGRRRTSQVWCCFSAVAYLALQIGTMELIYTVVAEGRYPTRDRHTVLRWRDFLTPFKRILSVRRDRGVYRDLSWDEVRWQI